MYRRSSCYKMAAPLNACTTIEQGGVVRFLWAKNMEAKDIHKEMLPMYGEHCLSCQAIHNWVQRFSEGRTSIEDEHRAAWPVEIAMLETLQRVEDIIRAERRVTVDAVATAIGCSRGQAYNMMHEGLGFHKVCSRWVPRQLTPQRKTREWACHCSISSATRMKGTTCFLGSSLVMSLGCTIMSPRRSVPPCSGNIPRPQRTRSLR